MRRAVVFVLSLSIGAAPLMALAQGKKPAAPALPAASASQSGAPKASAAASAPSAPSAPQAPAQLPDASTDTYRQHMDVGISFYEQKNYPAAIAEFEEAYKARPKASPLVNIALCYKAQFAYTKAIRSLEIALQKHSDTMDDNDKAAAQKEIDEMRARLSYVTFQVTPTLFQVEVDGELFADAWQNKPVALSPGPHDVKVTADGYEPVLQQLTFASGQHQLVYTLKPNMGFVHIKASDAKFAIAVDQKALSDKGEWSGLLPPGPHIIDMYIPGSASAPYRVRLDVEVGKIYDVTPGKGGVPIVGTQVQTPPPPPPPKKVDPPSPPVSGFFALASISLFGPLQQPSSFNGESVSPGVSAGARAGYRVNTPVSFDAMFEYSNVLVKKEKHEEINFNLEEVKGGINLRLQTPGKVARLYGSFGGGIVYESLDFTYQSVAQGYELCLTPRAITTRKKSCKDVSGVDGYFLSELGLQFSFGVVLVDLTAGLQLQSTRGFGIGTYDDWLPLFQGGLRVGYAAW